MNKISLIVIGILLFVGGFLLNNKQNIPFGSVTQGNEYRYVNYNVATSASTATVLKASPGSLGSVILTGTTASPLVIYQATTTDATKRATAATTSLTTVAQFPTGTTLGTYTFDISVPVGIMAVWGGTVSTSTITYR